MTDVILKRRQQIKIVLISERNNKRGAAEDWTLLFIRISLIGSALKAEFPKLNISK
jgi:hypothetical protein